MKKYTGKNVRHGDLVFSKIDKNVNGKKETEKLTLALGEFTGHSHRFEISGNTTIVWDDLGNGVKEFEVIGDPAPLIHEEHETIEFPAGKYRVEIQEEYDYFTEEMRQVID